MSPKELEPNKDKVIPTNEPVVKSVPATGISVDAVTKASMPANTNPTPAMAKSPAPQGKVTPGRRMRDSARRGGRGDGERRGGGKGGQPRERIKPEFDSKIIDIRRVTRVTAGGRRMNFSVAVVAGDKKGRVGVGLGKGLDTAAAVEKATREAKKHLIRVPLTSKMTLPHAIEGKYGSARIKIFPARGRGIVAGSSARVVIEMAGIKDVCAKLLSGSKNRLNNARVAIDALENISRMPRTMLHQKK